MAEINVSHFGDDGCDSYDISIVDRTKYFNIWLEDKPLEYDKTIENKTTMVLATCSPTELKQLNRQINQLLKSRPNGSKTRNTHH
jgi:hypothetical protein